LSARYKLRRRKIMEAVMDAINVRKEQLRKKILGILLSLTKDDIKRRSTDVTNNISKLKIYKAAKLVMAYFPLKGEVDLLGMIRKDLKSKRFCFPVVDKASGMLRVFQVQDLARDFVPGLYGVMEPDVSRSVEVSPEDIDLVLVPGVAFDLKKHRLGRGGGFYDRFLRLIRPPAVKIGTAFDCQITDDLPFKSAYDIAMDTVVMENQVI
jgi:5-formyltetrahydrofolate cyclo-ligase